MAVPGDGKDASGAPEVVVIGAGLAGLAAAVVLQRLGVPAVVLEAQARVGGRAHTVRCEADETAGLPAAAVELGPNYLHTCGDPRHQPLFRLCSRLGVPSVTAPGDDGGRLWGWAAVELADWSRPFGCCAGESCARRVAELVVLFEQAMASCCAEARASARPEELPLGPAFEAAVERLVVAQCAAGQREPLSPRERLALDALHRRRNGYVRSVDDLPLSEALRAPWPQAVEKGFHEEPSFGASAERSEHLEHLEEMIEAGHRRAASRKPVPSCEATCAGEDRILLGGGFGRVVAWLARQARAVRTGAPVRRVAYTCGGEAGAGGWCCRVDVRSPEDEGAAEEVACRAVIVTTPPGVLAGLDAASAVTFDPPLSDARLAALRRIAPRAAGAATHEKVVLRWPQGEVFWPREAPLLASPDPHLCFENLSRYPGFEGQLLVHLWPDGPIAVAGREQAAVVDALLEVLSTMFPEAAMKPGGLPRPRQMFVTGWGVNSFALGAYAAAGVGVQAGDWDAVAAPLPEGATPTATGPAVFFAGEHCARALRQTTAGAFVSGATAALQLARTLRPGKLSASDEERILGDLAAFLWPRDPRLDV